MKQIQYQASVTNALKQGRRARTKWHAMPPVKEASPTATRQAIQDDVTRRYGMEWNLVDFTTKAVDVKSKAVHVKEMHDYLTLTVILQGVQLNLTASFRGEKASGDYMKLRPVLAAFSQLVSTTSPIKAIHKGRELAALSTVTTMDEFLRELWIAATPVVGRDEATVTPVLVDNLLTTPVENP